jgi:hypothetical protein
MKAKRLIIAWSARERALIEHVKQNFLIDIEVLNICSGAQTLRRLPKSWNP